jgi:hypothetical protein
LLLQDSRGGARRLVGLDKLIKRGQSLGREEIEVGAERGQNGDLEKVPVNRAQLDADPQAIQVAIPFGRAEQLLLEQALGSRDDLRRIASIIAEAGAMELTALATGQAVFSSMADLRSYRIYCLLKTGLPRGDTEILVASIFKLPLGQARRLVNSAVARYAVELGGVAETIRQALKNAVWSPEPEGWLLDLSSELVRDRLSATLASKDLPDPERMKRGAIWRYPVETYSALREAFDLPPREPGVAESVAAEPVAARPRVAQPEAAKRGLGRVEKEAPKRKAK